MGGKNYLGTYDSLHGSLGVFIEANIIILPYYLRNDKVYRKF